MSLNIGPKIKTVYCPICESSNTKDILINHQNKDYYCLNCLKGFNEGDF